MGNLVPWEQFHAMMSLREAMNRLFEESFLRSDSFPMNEPANMHMPVDVFETENSLIVKAAVPGVKPEDLNVSITGDVLTIKGEYKDEPESQVQRNVVHQERRFGSFARSLTLPASIDSNNVTANFESGILTLEMPKVAEIKPKSIKISAKQ